MLDAALVAFGVVFVAELGDKSQLMVLAFATRHAALSILAGVAVAAGSLYALSVAVGGLLRTALPTRPLTVVAGVAFLAFALWTWRATDDEVVDRGDVPPPRGTRQAAVTAGVAFFIAELGDKTMLATVGLATTGHLVATWAGATAGMVAASTVAVVVGRQLGRRLPERALRVGATVAFALFGVALIVEAVRA